jgi:phage-related protein
MYNLELYKDARGNCPIQQFIAKLEVQAKTDKIARGQLRKLYYTMELLTQLGTRAGEKFTKQISGKLWELRPDKYRVFFFVWSDNNIILLHSFEKKTRKTPLLEIEKAKREMLDWIERNGL